MRDAISTRRNKSSADYAKSVVTKQEGSHGIQKERKKETRIVARSNVRTNSFATSISCTRERNTHRYRCKVTKLRFKNLFVGFKRGSISCSKQNQLGRSSRSFEMPSPESHARQNFDRAWRRKESSALFPLRAGSTVRASGEVRVLLSDRHSVGVN